MKKLLAATVLLSTFALPTHHVEAKTNLCEGQYNYYDATAINNAKDLELIRKGTYQVKGIKLNQTYKYVKAKIGKPTDVTINKDKEGTRLYATYGDYEFGFYSPKRYISNDSLKLYSIDIVLSGKSRMLRSEIQSILGEPQTKFYTDVEDMTEVFNYLHANYTEISNGWLAESISMYHPKYDNHATVYHKDNFRTNKLKNMKEKMLTSTQLKAMQKGTFSYNSIKPGYSLKKVKSIVGEANSEEYSHDDESHDLTQSFGVHDWITLDYEAENCDGNYKLYSMTFNYEHKQITEAKLRSILGKPSDVYDTSYVDEERGNKKITAKDMEYNNMYIALEKSGKTYYVTEISYEK